MNCRYTREGEQEHVGIKTVFQFHRHAMSVRRSRDDYEDFQDGGAEASAPPQPPPATLDPGAHIEMSAAVSGVVPDGEPWPQFC